MSAVDNFKNLKAEFEAKKKSMFAELKAEFGKQAKSYFDKYPEVNSIGVPAYTPYFSDGDRCTWSLRDWPESIHVNDQDFDGELDNMEDAPEYGTPEYDALNQKYLDACEFFSGFPNDFYEDVFDEGLITVFKDGRVEVQDYDHD